jgi:hypothetical protein
MVAVLPENVVSRDGCSASASASCIDPLLQIHSPLSAAAHGTMADPKTSPPSQGPAQERLDTLAESMINLTLLDPARWGWTAAGGVADLLPPHEVRACLRKDDTVLAGVSCSSEFGNILKGCH